MSKTWDFTLDQGADFEKILVISDLVDGVTTLRNLTGYTFRAQARTAFTDVAAVFAFSFALMDQTTNTGKVTMSIADTALTSLTLERNTKYKYDVEMIAADGKVTRIIEGTVTVSPEATKA